MKIIVIVIIFTKVLPIMFRSDKLQTHIIKIFSWKLWDSVYRQDQGWHNSSSGTKWAECLLIIRMVYYVEYMYLSLIPEGSVSCEEGIKSTREWVEASGLETWPHQMYVCNSVCEWAFYLLEICCLRLPSFESLACARASKLTTDMYISRARCDSQLAVKSNGLNTRWS